MNICYYIDENYNYGILDGEYKEYYSEEKQLKISCKYKNGKYDEEYIKIF